MSNPTLVITPVSTIRRRVEFCWPPVDTSLPKDQRPAPILTGFVDCEYIYHGQDELERLDECVASGEMSLAERFERMVPRVHGLPLENGETEHQWLNRHEYGVAVRNAITEDYWLATGNGRRGNSKQRRLR